MNKEEYQEYLQSPHWKMVQHAMYNIVTEDCEVCLQPREDFNIHHLSYENIYCERYSDLIVVCNECHKKIHDQKLKIKRGYSNRFVYNEELFSLMAYGGLSVIEAREHISRDIDDGYIVMPFEDKIVSIQDMLESYFNRLHVMEDTSEIIV